jgi:hypothetical protein
MSIALATRGYIAPTGGGGGGGPTPLSTPEITNITPTAEIVAGAPGAFSATFRTARLTPIEFDISSLASGARVTIAVAYADRNEKYVALEADSSTTVGEWAWPFDIEPDNSIGDLASEPIHVTLLPRGGWPATTVEIKVAACKIGIVV